MPRPPTPAATSSRLIPAAVRYVRARGGDADALIRRFGLPREVEAQPEAFISPTDFEPFIETAQASLGDPCLAVHLAEGLEWPSYSIPELVARASPTLREALEGVARYASLFYAHLVMTCTARDGEVVLAHRVRGARADRLRHSSEYALASALQHARRLTARPIAPSRVWFAHAEPPAVEGAAGGEPAEHRGRRLRGRSSPIVEELRRFFGTSSITFDRPDSGLAFADEIVALPTGTQDPRLLATAEALAERALRESPPPGDFARTVARRVEQALATGEVQASAVAAQLRLSPRTLHRRLQAEGTGFKEVLETVRRDLAREWVREGSLPLTEIAYRLGYSDAAAFSRAFKRWTGRAPGAYREAGPSA